MKFAFNHLTKSRAESFFIMILVAVLAAPSQAQALIKTPMLWTTVASAGTVNNSDIEKVEFSGGTVTLRNNQTATSAIIRYNIAATESFFSGGDGYSLIVRYRDNGGHAQVLVRLKEVDLATGATATRMTFDSNQFAQMTFSAYQMKSVYVCNPSWSFDFSKKAYFAEVQLIRTVDVPQSSDSVIEGTPISGEPGIAAIQIGTITC